MVIYMKISKIEVTHCCSIVKNIIQMLPKLFSTCVFTCPYKVRIKVFCQLPPILQQVIFFIYKTSYYNTFSTLKASCSTTLLSGERFITQFELKIIKLNNNLINSLGCGCSNDAKTYQGGNNP